MMQQRIDHFIGRGREIDIFRHWLTVADGSWILYIHDAVEEDEKKGGVGKTSLLKMWATLAKQAYPDIAIATIDFFNVADRDRVAVAEHIVAALQEAHPEWSPTSFTKAAEQYRGGEDRGTTSAESFDVADVQARDRLSTALTTDLQNLDSLLDDAGKALIVFFDTFEIVERSPVIAVLRLTQTFPDNYQFKRMAVVIAGRNALDWNQPNWIGREQEVRVMPIAPFTRQEMNEYLDSTSLYDLRPHSARMAALYERTEGRPILIGLVVDVLNHRILSLDELVSIPQLAFESYLVTQINKIDNPLNWVILFMAHVYHRFNINVLNWILREANLTLDIRSIEEQELLKTLPSLSFVRRPSSGDDFVLHDEMRRLVTKYCWDIQDPDQRNRKAISRCVIRYYEQELARGLSDQEQQSCIIEILYHTLFLNVDEGMKYFQQHFRHSISWWKTTFARLLLIEAQLFECSVSAEQFYDLKLAEALLLWAEENATQALDVHKHLEREADKQWLGDHRAALLFEKGRCYLQLSNFPEAIECFTACLEIEKTRGNTQRRAHLLGSLGYICRRRGQLEEALRYYEECVVLYKALGNMQEYANILNNMSSVYRYQGKIEEALRKCKISRRIRRDLFREGKISEVHVGHSLNVMGSIYLSADDDVQAEELFREAFEIFNRTGYRKGIAAMYNRFGQLQLVKDDLPQAKQWFEKAHDISLEVDAEAYVISLDGQGRVYASQHRWEEAATFFTQAIEHARRFHDSYHQIESLIDFAEALTYLEQYEQARDAWREVKDLATMDNYPYLLGRAEYIQGEIHYKTGDYETAFRHFGESCRYMALFNTLEYGKALRKVIDALLGVPKSDIPPLVNLLVKLWSAYGLDKSYPELMRACEEVDELIV